MLTVWVVPLMCYTSEFCFFFSSRRRHTRLTCDWSSDVCSSDLDSYDCRGRSQCQREIIYPFLPLFLALTLGSSPAIIGIIEGAAESVSSLLKLFARSEERRVGKECRSRGRRDH